MLYIFQHLAINISHCSLLSQGTKQPIYTKSRNAIADNGRAGMAVAQQSPLVQLVNISKQFPSVLAVDNVSLDILPGEVHVVAGENGAGKSTLMKLLSQVERPTSGRVLLNGQEVAIV